MVSETNLSHIVCHRAKALSCCSSVNELYLEKGEKNKFWFEVKTNYLFLFSISVECHLMEFMAICLRVPKVDRIPPKPTKAS